MPAPARSRGKRIGGPQRNAGHAGGGCGRSGAGGRLWARATHFPAGGSLYPATRSPGLKFSLLFANSRLPATAPAPAATSLREADDNENVCRRRTSAAARAQPMRDVNIIVSCASLPPMGAAVGG